MSEWERMENEPILWYTRFERYRLMGSNRSLLGVHKLEIAEKGRKGKSNKPPTKAPTAWDKAASEWNWKTRAEAWDMLEVERKAAAAALQQAKEEAEKEQERQEWRLKRKQLAQGLFAKTAAALNSIGSENPIANLSQVANTVKIALGELRAEFDDMPTQRAEFTKPIEINGLIAFTAEQELDEWRKQQLGKVSNMLSA